MTQTELHEARTKFLCDHTPTDRILAETCFREYSEYYTTAGGDATVYRVYGGSPDKFWVGIH